MGSFRFCGKSEVKGVVEYRIVRVFLRAGSSRFAKERTIPSHNNLHLNAMKTRSVVKTRWPLAMYVLYV